MAENKTQPTTASVKVFLDSIENEARRKDARAVEKMMREATGEKPVMWGPSIVGFGRYRYKYNSGREGEMCRVGFSPRKANLVIYLITGFEGEAALLAKLGKHKIGKSCLYLNRLADVDEGVLRTLIARSLAAMQKAYPT